VKDTKVTWAIRGFSRNTKNAFIGECKKQGKDWKLLLGNFIRNWLFENEGKR